MDYFGPITIEKIENLCTPPTGPEEGAPTMKEMQANDARFVHYPDCQQLILYLPQYGREYGMLRLLDRNSGAILEEWPVADRLNGSVQILWDTLPIPPGAYAIEIEWKSGWRHRIELVKHEEGYVEKKPQPEAPPASPASSGPIVYRDGFGNIIPNQDLLLREKAYNEMAARFGRRLEYEGNFRGGTIIYVEGELRIKFYHEMGGGKCKFYIDIPTAEQWEAQTGTPLSRREEILTFVAQTVQREQASSWRYEIGEGEIGFY